MSFEITTAFVDQFKDNVIILSQQRGSRLEGLVRREEITGKRKAFERIGPTEARKRLSRHSDTPRIDTPHSRRWTSQADYDWADLVDDEDRARMLISPESSYAINAAYAMGRAKDKVIIDAALGDAVYGEDGTASTPLPSDQKVAVNATVTGTGSNTNLTIDKLMLARDILGKKEVIDDSEFTPLFVVVSQDQLTSLLTDTKVQSADYNTVRALVAGTVNSFMGFTFIRTELLPKSSNVRSCFAFVGGPMSGIALAVGREVKARMSERDDKNYALQVFLSMSLGAVRVEDEKVVQVDCDETA